MSSQISLLSPSNVASTTALPISVTTDELLSHIGAQFYRSIETSKAAIAATASSSAALTRRPNDASSHRTVLEKYLQTANRTEVLFLGARSSRSSRVFDNHLISTMDKSLLQFEANNTATPEAISASA
jgi:hypothetical protein